MHKVRLGDISVNYIIARLLEFEDLIISRPVTENSRYDLIVDNGNKLIRLQIKTIYWSKAERCYMMNAFSVNRLSKGRFKKNFYTKDEVDFLVGFNPVNKEYFVFPIEDVTVQAIRIKEIEVSPKRKVFMAMKYKERFDLILT